MRDIVYLTLIAFLMIGFIMSRRSTRETQKRFRNVVRMHNRNVLVGIKDKDYNINDDLNKENSFFYMNNTGELPHEKFVLHYTTLAKQEDFYF